MKVLLVHNYYQQAGGEDQVFRAERELLEGHGHTVIPFTVHNDDLEGIPRANVAAGTLWNQAIYRELRQLIRREKPEIAHFHNTFPMISPAAYYAAHREKLPTVQTLHNYRLLCVNGIFFRDGRVCEDCLGKPVPLPGVIHSCYRGSRAYSGGVAAMLTVHRLLGTWRNRIDRYITLTEFSREKMISGGLPEDRIAVKPNFVYPDPEVGGGGGGYALFVGRLSEEKGVATLLEAWRRHTDLPLLKIVGDGPASPDVRRASGDLANVEWLGSRNREEVLALMRSAQTLVFPSIWYEGFPMVMVEAYGSGLPIISSDLGSMSDIVDHGHTGLKFPPADPDALAASVRRLFSHPEEHREMRRKALEKYRTNYSAEANYETLVAIYGSLL